MTKNRALWKIFAAAAALSFVIGLFQLRGKATFGALDVLGATLDGLSVFGVMVFAFAATSLLPMIFWRIFSYVFVAWICISIYRVLHEAFTDIKSSNLFYLIIGLTFILAWQGAKLRAIYLLGQGRTATR